MKSKNVLVFLTFLFGCTGLAITASLPTSQEPVKARFDNYKVYRFIPQNVGERQVLLDIERDFPVMFWKRVGPVGAPTDIMIPPHLLPEILSGVQKLTTMQTSEAWIEDVQKLIDEQESLNNAALAKAPKLSWDAYYDYEQIEEFLFEQQALHPNITDVQIIGRTYEDRPMYVIQISTGGDKPVIWIDANIHAREWITNAVATYIINELLNGEASGLKSLLDDFDFHINPVLNPDGYAYTWSTNRLWRKTRSAHAGGSCRGADANRNFGFHWNTGGSSSNCNSDTFHGVAPFSESETKAIADYLNGTHDRVAAYLSIHSYSQFIMIPYGTTALGRVPDHENQMRVGRLVEAAIARRYGTDFLTGNWAEILYESSGVSADWMKGVHNTTLSYTFELRDEGQYGFLLPPDQIIPSSLEFVDGLIVLCNELKADQRNGQK